MFLIFFNMKLCYVFSLESSNRGNSNEYKQYAIFNIKKITLNYPICSYGISNEPSMLELLKVYCISMLDLR